MVEVRWGRHVDFQSSRFQKHTSWCLCLRWSKSSGIHADTFLSGNFALMDRIQDVNVHFKHPDYCATNHWPKYRWKSDKAKSEDDSDGRLEVGELITRWSWSVPYSTYIQTRKGKIIQWKKVRRYKGAKPGTHTNWIWFRGCDPSKGSKPQGNLLPCLFFVCGLTSNPISNVM